MRALRLAAAAALVALLGGCATIPMSGAVSEGRTGVSAAPNLSITAAGPTNGASPKDIVAGFVAAQQGSSFAVAREFLTKEFAAKWDPSFEALLHDQLLTPKAVATGSVTMTVPYTASIDAGGVYSALPNSKKLQFSLTQVQGQWRISDGPDGILLPSAIFPRTYQPVTLQYFSPDFARLVPDVRWFPNRLASERTVLRSLLAGQAPQLAGATASAFPVGTRVATPPTTVGGVSNVVLDTPGGPPSTAVLTRMFQQLAASLQVKSSAQLQLTVDGRVATASVLQDPQADSRPAVLSGSRFGLLQSTGVVTETALGRRIAATSPAAVTLSRQGWAAVLTGTGVQVVSGTGTPRTIDARQGLLAPTIDQNGWVYSVPGNDPTGLVAVDHATGKRAALETDLPGATVSAIEVSRDGTRLLALVQTSDGAEAVVAGIERDSSGAPVGLTAKRYVQPISDPNARGATWVSDSQFAVLTGATTGDDVVEYQVGGLSNDLGKLSDVGSIVGGNGGSDLRALLASGDLSVNGSGNQWQAEFANPVNVQVLAVQR